MSNILNINKSIINQFYNQSFTYHRNKYVTLPPREKQYDNVWYSAIPNDTRNDIYKFIVIWYGVYEIVIRSDEFKAQSVCDRFMKKANIFGDYSH